MFKKLGCLLVMMFMPVMAFAFSAAHSSGHSSSHATSHGYAHTSPAHSLPLKLLLIPKGHINPTSTQTIESDDPDYDRLKNCEVVDEDKMCSKYMVETHDDTGVWVVICVVMFGLLFGAFMGIMEIVSDGKPWK